MRGQGISGVYPRGGPRPTSSQAEKTLYAELVNRLPEGWAAWHSLRIRTGRGFEGEGDFVIAVPKAGLLIVEVKGGHIQVRDGQWLQNGRRMERAPREQANRFARTLADKLQEKLGGRHPSFGVVTAFPDIAFSNPPGQGDLQGVVLGQQDLSWLDGALQSVAERVLADAREPPPGWLQVVHSLWGETWTPALSLGDRIALRERQLVPLDEQQCDLLDLIFDNKRVQVTGGPGTGKTLLAREVQRRFAQAGKQPVLLCSTSALARRLRDLDPLEAHTVRELAATLLKEAGVSMQNGADPRDWTAQTWDLAPLQAAADALDLARERYHSVVVDEVQDFSENDWEFVGALAAGRPLWAFGDSGQGFWSDRKIPSDLFTTQFHLPRRYRCPEPLARFADQYREKVAGEDDAVVRVPAELRVSVAPSDTALEDYVAKEIQRALGEGADPGDVAVLSLGGQTVTQLCVRDHIGQHAVVRGDHPDAAKRVIADTFLRFKGLERPWIIVCELGLGKSRYDVRMHVALTRATVGAVVVGTRGEIESDSRLDEHRSSAS